MIADEGALEIKEPTQHSLPDLVQVEPHNTEKSNETKLPETRQDLCILPDVPKTNVTSSLEEAIHPFTPMDTCSNAFEALLMPPPKNSAVAVERTSQQTSPSATATTAAKSNQPNVFAVSKPTTDLMHVTPITEKNTPTGKSMSASLAAEDELPVPPIESKTSISEETMQMPPLMGKATATKDTYQLPYPMIMSPPLDESIHVTVPLRPDPATDEMIHLPLQTSFSVPASASGELHGFGASTPFVAPDNTAVVAPQSQTVVTAELLSNSTPHATHIRDLSVLSAPFPYDDYMFDDDGNSDGTEGETVVSKSNPSLGKVVESGQEHTGRWTREEHEAFLSALQLYGKEWKKVAGKVKTRTVVQTRTHAQKYFQKLQKTVGGYSTLREMTALELGAAADAKKTISVSLRKKTQSGRQWSSTESATSATAAVHQEQHVAQSEAAAEAAAQLISHMSQGHVHASTPPPFLETSSVTNYEFNAESTQTSLSHQFATSQKFVDFSNYQQSIMDESNAYSASVDQLYSSETPRVVNTAHMAPMKIVAPLPDQSMKQGLFPEPSPAACGKRRLAEMAAAQMLAGVAASTISKSLMDDISGQATPPLPDTERSCKDNGDVQHQEVYRSAPPTVLTPRLQILNPDLLSRSYYDGTNGGGKRNSLGLPSPSTPWDGQLEALISESKNKENDATEEACRSILGTEPGHTDEFDVAIAPHPLQETGRPYLYTAICNGSVEEVRRLIELKKSECREEQVTETEFLSAFVRQRDSTGFTPLHLVACLRPRDNFDNASMEIIHLLLSAGADPVCFDKFGNSALHWAARAGNSEVASVLIMRNCPLDSQNVFGETSLHWAMREGAAGTKVVQVLLESGARPSVFNKKHRRPLDVAVDGFSEVDDAMTTQKASALINNESKVYSAGKLKGQKRLKRGDLCQTSAALEEKRRVRENFLRQSPQSRTLVLHHSECLDHIPKSERDWECPDRVKSILNCIMTASASDNSANRDSGSKAIQDHEVTISTEFDRAPLELLSRVHSADYLSFVNELSKELERRRKKKITDGRQDTSEKSNTRDKPDPFVIPFTPMVQRTVMKESIVKRGAHSDTSFCAGSLRAARRAAGAVQHAVDRVLIGRNRNAFCVVRPPGHHAGVNGLLAGGESCGFCIFNNIAAGAMHALSDESHRPKCDRCAIVDIDAHHGNGTEEIIRKCQDPGRLLFFSVHLFDNDKKRGRGTAAYKFYPGTGDEDNVEHNIINVPIMPFWKEEQNASAAADTAPVIDNNHNTRHKSKRIAAAAAATEPGIPLFESSEDSASDRGEKAKAKDMTTSDSEAGSIGRTFPSTNSNSPVRSSAAQTAHYIKGVGRQAYRRAIQQRLLPALRAFNPDLILISTGFDASRGDVGNARHYLGGGESMGLDLEPEDYAWTTRKILEIADICCQGRVVSVLEGGYGRTTTVTPPKNGTDESQTCPSPYYLDKTLFSECALRHLQALIDPYDAEKRYPE